VQAIPDPQIIAAQLRQRTTLRPALAMVLGSGFHHLAAQLTVILDIPFAEISGFQILRVPSHSGRFLLGYLSKVPVVVLSGRSHFYEGHSMASLTFPVRVLKEFGVRDLVLTNAAGGINEKFRPGDFMYLTDQINLMGANPLRGTTYASASPFVDLSHTYDSALNRLLQKAAAQSGARLHPGIYLAVSGPSYETPAEIRAFKRLGADAVGMSTVPEAIVARHCGLNVAAISCITNVAAGLSEAPLSHDDVLAAGERVKSVASRLLENFARLNEGEKPI